MGRKDDPEGVSYECERKGVCSVHQFFVESMQDLSTTVKGNGTVQSKENSLVGIVSTMRTTLTTNGRWLKGVAALIVSIFLALIIPVMSWTQTSGKIIRQIEVNTIRLEKLEAVKNGGTR